MAGALRPHQLNSLIPNALVEKWKARYSRHTTYQRRSALKRLLRFIEDTRHERGLADQLPKAPKPLPRTQIATPEERRRLLDTAEPWFRCFLLLCNDLALRSGTAARVAPCHYFADTKTLRIRTKGGFEIELPVSPALAALFEHAPITDDPTTPFWQLLKGRQQRPLTHDPRKPHGMNVLAKRWARLKKQCRIPTHIRFHDLRRSAAMSIMDTTLDIRSASHALGHQSIASTAWYLQHRDTEKLRRELLVHWWTPRRKEPVQ